MVLSPEQQLAVEFRLEPGCLGPQGERYIDAFCAFAERSFATSHIGVVDYRVVPRRDKSLAEVQYRVNGRVLNRDQASRYLTMVQGTDADSFENHLNDALVTCIDKFFKR